jgi:hypothetical protein
MESNFDELVEALTNCNVPFKSFAGIEAIGGSWIEIRSTMDKRSDMVTDIWFNADGSFSYTDIYEE